MDYQRLYRVIAEALRKDQELEATFFTGEPADRKFDTGKFRRTVASDMTPGGGRADIPATAGDSQPGDSVELRWPHKGCLLKGGLSKGEVGGKDVFCDVTGDDVEAARLTAPKAFRHFLRHDATGPHPTDDLLPTDNLVIKGENLQVLCSMRSRFSGRIKLIYIDPPYNTGNTDFGYHDHFSHDTWLTFMKNRIDTAVELLADDGILFVQCDDNENAYLKVMLDESDQLQFMSNIAVKMSEPTGFKMNYASDHFPKLKEYILVYKKSGFGDFVDIDKYKTETWDPENDIFLDGMTVALRRRMTDIEKAGRPGQDVLATLNRWLSGVRMVPLAKVMDGKHFADEGARRRWLFAHSYQIAKTAGSTSLSKLMRANEDKIPCGQDIAAYTSPQGVLFYYLCHFNRSAREPRLRIVFADGNLYKHPCDFWQDIKTTGGIAREGGVSFPNGKKPEKLLHRIIMMTTRPGDWVLDFHAGSGTTAAVAHKMGRRYIVCEQEDETYDLCLQRLHNVIAGDTTGISRQVGWRGGGSFVSCELASTGHDYVALTTVDTVDDSVISPADRHLNHLLHEPPKEGKTG